MGVTVTMCLHCSVTHRNPHKGNNQDKETDTKTEQTSSRGKTDRHTDTQTDRQTDTQTDRQCQKLNKVTRTQRSVPYVPWKAGIRLATFLEDRERDSILHCSHSVQSEIHSLASLPRAPWYEMKAGSQSTDIQTDGARNQEEGEVVEQGGEEGIPQQ